MKKTLILSLAANVLLVFMVCNQTAKYSDCMRSLTEEIESQHKWNKKQ